MTAKKKTPKRKNARPKIHKTPQAALSAPLETAVFPAPSQPLPSFAPTAWIWLLAAVFFILWRVCSNDHYTDAATIFFVLGAALAGSGYFSRFKLGLVLGLIGLGWVGVTLGLGQYHNFQYAFSFLDDFEVPFPVVTFAVGMGLMTGLWRFLPKLKMEDDFPRAVSRILFWIIFAGAAFLRLYHLHEAVGPYWDDPATCVVDPQQVLNFHIHPMLFPLGNREPFYSYFLVGLWSLMPGAYAILIQRLGSAILDLLAVWVFYLLGKEVGGRKAGLVAMALGAFSKEMIIGGLIGMTSVTAPLAVGLMLLMTVRLFKKNDWNHFLKWGLSIGFAVYNYTVVRPWILFLVVAVFLWMWFYKQKGINRSRVDFWLGWGTVLTWCFLFLALNNFLPLQAPWVVFLNRTGTGVVVLALLWFLYFRSKPEGQPALSPLRGPSLVPRFFFALFIAGAIIYPLATSPAISEHPSALSIFHNRDARTLLTKPQVVQMVLDKTWASLQTMFLAGQDRGDLNLVSDAFFEYHFLPIFALGLAALLAQPSWMGLFLMAGGWVGISPHILSIDPHSAKLVSAMPAIAALAGLGVSQLFGAWEGFSPRKWLARSVFVLSLLAYFAWGVWGSFDRVWKMYANHNEMEKIVSNIIGRYYTQDRVYIGIYAYFVSSQTQAVLEQGRHVYTVEPQDNPIYLRPGEPRKNVLVLLSNADQARQALIKAQFPTAVWVPVGRTGEGPRPAQDPAVAQYVTIPADAIGDKPGKLFYFQTVPAGDWIRDYYMGHNLLGDGLIEMEEIVPSPNADVPSVMNGRMVRLSGVLNMPAAARVTFKTKSLNYVILDVDGKNVISLMPFQKEISQSGSLSLSAGEHPVDYVTYLQYERVVPKVFMSVNGGSDQLMGAEPTPVPQP